VPLPNRVRIVVRRVLPPRKHQLLLLKPNLLLRRARSGLAQPGIVRPCAKRSAGPAVKPIVRKLTAKRHRVRGLNANCFRRYALGVKINNRIA
jgi:hypothetical protein